jgi:hypothetical protein
MKEPASFKEFRDKGFVSSDPHLMRYFHGHREARWARFSSAIHRTTGFTYSALDLLGGVFVLYHDPGRPELISQYLEKKFFERNPDPPPKMKMAFSLLMHQQNLHWSGCAHGRHTKKYLCGYFRWGRPG